MVAVGFNAAVRYHPVLSTYFYNCDKMYDLYLFKTNVRTLKCSHFALLTCTDSFAISVRVSNELGANHPKAAKFSVIVATTTSAAIGLIFTAVALAARKQMPRLFTSDDAVVKETAKLGYLLAATIFLNSIQPVLSGTEAHIFVESLDVLSNFFLFFQQILMTCSVVGCRCGDRRRVAVLGRFRQHRLLLPRWSAPRSCFRLQAEA